MEFIAAHTDPEEVMAEYDLSEILGREIEAWLAAGAPAMPAPTPRKRTCTHEVRRWAVRDGQITSWTESVTEEF